MKSTSFLTIGWLLCLVDCSGCGTESISPPERSDVRRSNSAEAGRDSWPTARLPEKSTARTSARAPRNDDWFEDMTDGSGVSWAYRNGFEAKFFTLLETVGGGVALWDFDRDGDLDLFIAGGGELSGPPIHVAGRPSVLYRNDGDWQFRDVTSEMGLDTSRLYSHGCAVGDFDRDGYSDLAISGFGGIQLWKNESGHRLREVTEQAGLQNKSWATGLAWADYDRDGWLDLYVTNYVEWQPGEPEICLQDRADGKYHDTCAPTLYSGQRDALWHNRRDGRFEDVSDQAGLVPRMRGLGVVAEDFDGDHWIDFFVTNDVNENQMYWGGPELPFRETGVLSGVALSPTGEREGSMGVEVADFNGDGDADLFYTNFAWQDNSLLLWSGQRGFLNVTARWGLAEASRRWVGFGTVAGDFDLDGWPDLFVANGHVLYEGPNSPHYQPAQLFRNVAGNRMAEVTEQSGPYFSVPHVGRGVAVGDLDNNGTPDIVVVHQNDSVTLLRNRRVAGPFVSLLLKGTISNPDAVGARVTVQQGEQHWTQWIRGGGSYLSHSDLRLLFALPTDAPVTATVTWPSGTTEVFSELVVRKPHQLREGTGYAE